VIRDPVADIYVPVFAGEYTAAECAGRDQYTIDGKEYEECAFCRASCPSRDVFKEPDSGLPLKCDMCESDPTLEEPLCVTWCLAEALIYECVEVDAGANREAEGAVPEEIDAGLEALAKKHGWSKLIDAVGRMSKNGNR
jgi:benzoyl-CoA reductase subunit BamC